MTSEVIILLKDNVNQITSNLTKMDIKRYVNTEVLSSRIDEEVVLMSMEAESYFGLDPIGSRIWELLSQQPSTANELVVMLMKEYEILEDTCRTQVRQFIEDMLTKKLIY